MALDFNTIQKVNILFEERKWKISSKEGSLYDDYCKRLDLLKDNPLQELMLDLTKRFYIATLNQIFEDIQTAFFNVDENIYTMYNKIYILPLTKKLFVEPIPPKTKSGEAYFYHLRNSDFLSWFDYYPKKFVFQESLHNINLTDTTIAFFFVDDYVGSGKTVIEVLDGINQKFQTNINNRSHILVPFAQQNAIDELKNGHGVKVFSSTTFKKGITDYYQNFADKIELMKKIEKCIDKKLPNSDNHLGFGKTEGLIRLVEKTPNNTFPLFWYKPKGKKANPAPFPRHTNS